MSDLGRNSGMACFGVGWSQYGRGWLRYWSFDRRLATRCFSTSTYVHSTIFLLFDLLVQLTQDKTAANLRQAWSIELV